jgi:hypothetical protein
MRGFYKLKPAIYLTDYMNGKQSTARSEVLIKVLLQMKFFWDVTTLCCLPNIHSYTPNNI